MPTIHFAPVGEIQIFEGRVRKAFDPAKLAELAADIEAHGLLHPVVVRRGPDGRLILIAGETRIKAMQQIYGLSGTFKCAEHDVPPGHIPYTDIGELPDDEALEIELSENVCRQDLSWQEKADATAKLHALRTRQAEAKGEAYTMRDLAVEAGLNSHYGPEMRKRVLVGEHLDDPEIRRAPSEKAAVALLTRKLERKAAESRPVPTTEHLLIKGDALQVIKTLADGSFVCICTDPPYGIEADRTSQSPGSARGGQQHSYDDTPENVDKLMRAIMPELYRVAAPESHLYMFCAITRWPFIRGLLKEAGWWAWPRPLIWHKNSGQGVFAEWGPVFRYECIAYAIKGKKPVVLTGKGDVLRYDGVEQKEHPAEKPVDLLVDLLERSTLRGDKIFDPFAGSGSIIPAARSLHLQVTCIEKDDVAYELCRSRIRTNHFDGDSD